MKSIALMIRCGQSQSKMTLATELIVATRCHATTLRALQNSDQISCLR